MPDQPDDPLDYDMKIPPEGDESKHRNDSEKAESDDSTHASNSSKESDIKGGADESKADRH